MTQPRERRTAVGYARVSADDQVGHISLHFQEIRIRRWCDRNGFELIALSRDEGEPGYARRQRLQPPELRKLLGQLPTLRPNVVVVHSLDRLTRSLAVASETSHQLSALGIALVSVTD